MLIQSHPHSNVIICGDFNTSFERHNAQTRCLNNFVLRNNLRVAWESSKSQKAPTYVNYNLGHSSCIDHFAVSTDIYDSIVTNYVESDPTNFSSHNVVILEFEYQVETDRYAYVDETEEKHCKWSKATADDICKYRHVLDSILEHMVLPTDMLRCENVHCNNRAHTEYIDTMCSDIINACLQASDDVIPQTDGKRSTSIPYWNENIKEHKERSLFWHWIWCEGGKINTGIVYNIMRRTRHQYHYAVRSARKHDTENRKLRLAEASCANNSKDMWGELKRMNPKGKYLSNVVDGINNDADIANMFADKYRSLYQSVPTSDLEMDSLIGMINASIISMQESNNIAYSIGTEQVFNAIRKLKNDKRDGLQDFYSNYITNASDRMHILLTLLINSMVIHGHWPPELLNSTIVSIPKDNRGSLSNSENYRGIALSNCICKIIDTVLLNKYSAFLASSSLQFAFKKHHSTVLCTAILLETVSYFKERNSNVYSCMLDASKAFDRINHGKLFRLLLQRGMPPLIGRFFN